MKNTRWLIPLCCLLGLLCNAHPALGHVDVPPNVASYTIDVHYDPDTHLLTADQTATYRNRTDAPISDLVFHLYLNAFKSAETLWMQEGDISMRSYSFDPASPGWTRIEQITLDDGTPLTLEPVDVDETLVRADLPQPIALGDSVTVHIAFTAQLPKVFARTGWADGSNFVMAGQWFPKFGVWEDGAWNAYPFHANSEFYADFGRYDVTLTLPTGWVVANTGIVDGELQTTDDGTATHTLRADHVIDFAWAASPDFHEMTTEVDGVTVRVVYPSKQRAMARRVLKATADTLPLYNTWYGRYGKGLYPQLTVVVVPKDASGAGGMEYPTLFTVGAMGGNTPKCIRLLEAETVHELGHQWFQSVVATNEAEAPWLDEGFTDYSTIRAMNALYDGTVFGCAGWHFSYLALRRTEYVALPSTPMAGKAWDFDGIDYGIATYSKPALALTTLERIVGEEAMVDFLRAYFDHYAFAHPTATDVRAVMTEILGKDVSAWFFDGLVHDDGTLDAQALRSDSGITLQRQGDFCIPTIVSITRNSRETEETPWTCNAPTMALDDIAKTVQIDPSDAIVLDQNLANNGTRRNPDVAPWLGVAARWLRILQDFFWGGAAW